MYANFYSDQLLLQVFGNETHWDHRPKYDKKKSNHNYLYFELLKREYY